MKAEIAAPSAPPPWLAAACETLRRARASGRFPPALLIHEQPGCGGDWLAGFAAQAALCRGADAPCGHCEDCRRAAAGQHPDLLRLGPAEDSQYIRVEQVRELCGELALTAHGGGATVAIIAPAEAMNVNAANALLKTLEEPRPGATLVLVSAAPSRLPATVRSRCQRLRVPVPSRAECLAWLRATGGAQDWDAVLDVVGNAPLTAQRLDPAALVKLRDETAAALDDAARASLDIPGTADRWAKSPTYELRLDCIENWLTVRLEQAARSAAENAESRGLQPLPSRRSHLNMKTLVRSLDALHELGQLGSTSVNKALALEQLLWELAPPAAGQAGRGAAARRP